MCMFGALMLCWGRVIKVLPQVVLVSIASCLCPLLIPDNWKCFETEDQDLSKDIWSLPSKCHPHEALRLNQAGQAGKIQVYINSSLKKKMPSSLGKSEKELVSNLGELSGNIRSPPQTS